MLHVALGRLNQVGNEVIATLELHINLGKCIFKTVFKLNQFIVYGDEKRNCQNNYGQ